MPDNLLENGCFSVTSGKMYICWQPQMKTKFKFNITLELWLWSIYLIPWSNLYIVSSRLCHISECLIFTFKIIIFTVKYLKMSNAFPSRRSLQQNLTLSILHAGICYYQNAGWKAWNTLFHAFPWKLYSAPEHELEDNISVLSTSWDCFNPYSFWI